MWCVGVTRVCARVCVCVDVWPQPTETYYALKVMQKARIVEMSQQTNVVSEKKIMMLANHPYVRRSAPRFKLCLDRCCSSARAFSVVSCCRS